MKTNNTTYDSNIKIVKAFVFSLILSIFPLIGSIQANAAPITGRSIVLSSSAGDASGVTYTLSSASLPTSGTAVKSFGIQFCTSLTGGCVIPAGFSSAATTLSSQPTGLGAGSGWTANTGLTGSLRIVNAANSTNPSGAVSIVWNSVHNPTAINTPFYGIITSYSDAAWTTPIDTGSVALSTSGQIQVGLTVSETLTFCTGTSITGQNCGTVAGSVVNLGEGSTTAPASGTSVMAASTNGATGYSVAVSGATLTSGSNTIDAMTAGGTSSVGSKQFGFNLAAANTAPVVGAAVSGSGIGTAAANYSTNNNFRFNSGDVIASAAGSSNANTFTVAYIANIDGVTPAGAYNTILTYTATANF